MDVLIWNITIFLEAILLLGIVSMRRYRLVPWFTVCIAFSTVESYPLAMTLRYGSALDYYLTYYAFDLLNVGLYIAAIRECWHKGYLFPISASMVLYLIPKAVTYGVLISGHRDAGLALTGDLRYMNIACYRVWIPLIWGYDVFGPRHKSTQGEPHGT